MTSVRERKNDGLCVGGGGGIPELTRSDAIVVEIDDLEGRLVDHVHFAGHFTISEIG